MSTTKPPCIPQICRWRHRLVQMELHPNCHIYCRRRHRRLVDQTTPRPINIFFPNCNGPPQGPFGWSLLSRTQTFRLQTNSYMYHTAFLKIL